MENEKYYPTSDLGLIASLSLTYKIEKIDRTDPRKVLFYFIDSPELQKKVIAFTNKKLKVDAQSYYEQIRAIKIMIYERKREATS
jgi:hypothetical protein